MKNSNLNKAINVAVKAKAQNQAPQKYIDELREQVQAGDSRAVSTLQDLLNLIVITYNESTLLMGGMGEFVSQFIDAPRSDNGNGRRYIKHFTQPGDNYAPNDFVATGTNEPRFKVAFIKFKNDNGTLAAGSEQKRFKIVYRKPDLITYFVNGQLREFIDEWIVSQIDDSLKIYLYDYVIKKLVDTNNNGKSINGTATNIFDCFTQEIFPECKKMLLNDAAYNVDKTLTESIDASDKDDLIMLMSVKTKTMLESNIKSQLFNSTKIDLNNYVGQVHVPNNKFTFNGNTVGVEAAQYIPENKIIVFDRRNYLRVLTMLEASGRQDYPLNMSTLEVLHRWVASGKLPWGKVFTYTNNNLNTSPSA